MNDVRLDAQQVPARAELLLAAERGEDAPGRPIYARPEPDGHGDREPSARIKVGAVLTRRLSTAEATEMPSGAAYGNPLRGRPEHSPSMPIGSALLARTDAADARGWRVYRVTPAGNVIYDEWIDHDAASGELAVARLRAAARRSPEAVLRRVLDEHRDHAAAPGVAEWLANEQVERHGSRKPRSRAARRRWRRSLARRRAGRRGAPGDPVGNAGTRSDRLRALPPR